MRPAAEDLRQDWECNPHLRGLGPSATLAINERSAALAAQGREVWRLGFGQSPFPVPATVVEALREHAHCKDYLPVRGLPALRAAVAEFHRQREHIELSAEDILIGPGSKELMFILQLVFPAELVLAAPSWVSYAPQAQMLGRRVHWLAARRDDGWRLPPQQLDAFCSRAPRQQRLLVLNYPDNPTGVTYSAAELQALAEVARRHGLLILSDEIYGELHFTGEHVSIARYCPERTIVSGGLSKWCGAGGWRLGTFAFPPGLRWLQDAMAVVASETYTSTSAPIQYAAVRAFTGDAAIERYLQDARRIIAAVAGYTARRLRAAGVQVAEPQGGFYVFPDFQPLGARLAKIDIASSALMCQQLLEDTGVATLPGSAFGRPAAELTARIACVDFDGAAALAAAADVPPGASLDHAFLETHCPRMIEAMRRIEGWVRAC